MVKFEDSVIARDKVPGDWEDDKIIWSYNISQEAPRGTVLYNSDFVLYVIMWKFPI